MTGHWFDIQNCDYILHCGSNSVENHPVSSKWLNRAVDKGARWIVVDPRYTRTAELADLYCPIRSGTDIAFYGGMVNYILENDRWQHEYVLNYTNASYLIDPDFDFDPETGLFSGWDEETKTYDKTTWGYQTESETKWDTSSTGAYSWVNDPGVPEFTPPVLKTPKKDPTLEDPNCVLNIMKEHYSRYTIDAVAATCGVDADVLEEVYSVYTESGAPEKSGAILYALGQTQHSYGTNNTRSMCIIQLLLGNVGMAGGGVLALRGEPNVQGATDMCLMPPDLPGYLHWPTADHTLTLADWCATETYSDGYYTNKPKFMVSFLKEFFGENATVKNDYGYGWLPKVENAGNFTSIGTFELMNQDKMKGYFSLGMNPAHSGGNTKAIRNALAHLDWLVTLDLYMTETASFWDAPDMQEKAADIATESYFLPVASILEKPGTILNSGRQLQWRQQAIEPAVDPDDPTNTQKGTKSDLVIFDLLWKRIVKLYEEEGGTAPEPILNTKWDYYAPGSDEVSWNAVAWALNGYRPEGTDFGKGKVDLLSGFPELKADGTTSCAIWIYSGFYNNSEAPLDPSQQPVCRRGKEDPTGLAIYQNWAYTWPANRRIIYNRASCDLEGNPWNEDKCLVKWDKDHWILNDVSDFVASKTLADGTVEAVPPNNKAFFMRWEQNACLLTTGLNDMPIPEHYEPLESPVDNAFNGSQNNPCIKFAEFEMIHKADRTNYPIVATTYSVTEHWQTGAQTHACPALNELQPKQFAEISEELAKEKGISNGDLIRVYNERGDVTVYAMVTKRFVPFEVQGQTVHQIGLIHHWGWANTFTQDDVVNDLTPNCGDPNSYIPEYKAFLVNVEKA